MVEPPCTHPHRVPRLSCNNLVMDRPQAKGIHLHQVTVLPQRLLDMEPLHLLQAMEPLGMGPPSLGMEPLHLLLAMELLDPQWEETKCRP